jgi:DNA-binding MarR family transcriptional regulator
MTMQEGLGALGVGAGARQTQDRAYFLDLLGDSHSGLGRYEAAIDAYRQAAQEFQAQRARCSHALCLLKIADCYLALDEPWHAIGYLEACLPRLRELGLIRQEDYAQQQLAACRAGLAEARLVGRRLPGKRLPELGPPSPLPAPGRRYIQGMPDADGQPRWLTDEEQQAWRATIQLSQLLLRQLDRDLIAHGLNSRDYEILVELSEAPERRLRMTELADATSQSRSRLSHQISRMEKRGLVRRDDCEGDKRGTFAVLTKAGFAAIERVAPYHVDNVRRHFIDRLTPDQLEEVRATFQPIVDYLRKIRERD